jgi:hypothetical protein
MAGGFFVYWEAAEGKREDTGKEDHREHKGSQREY